MNVDAPAGAGESIVADTAARLFADLADPQTVNRAKDDGWKAPLWRALEDAGLTRAWVPERLGGADATLADGFAILREAGRVALAVPLAETLIAGWLLSRAGIEVPEGALSVVPARPQSRIRIEKDGALRGEATAVPFGSHVRRFAVLATSADGTTVSLVEAKDCRIGGGRNLAGDPVNTIGLDGARPSRSAAVDVDLTMLMLFGATVRAMQTAGALETALALSVAYANERVAFERPIGKFQAVQQSLARLAGETAAALAVASSAADTFEQADAREDAIFLEAASAKIRCAEAATEGAAIAHQVFGAIGFTNEHVLHRFTLRMKAWRDDFGNESYWANELGRRVAALGADEFWPLVASR
jgi:alkylation response protein AidB-like acyl-CoA dehydrogenase